MDKDVSKDCPISISQILHYSPLVGNNSTIRQDNCAGFIVIIYFSQFLAKGTFASFSGRTAL